MPSVRGRTKVALVVLGVFALMQLFPYRVTNPPERTDPPWDSPATRRLVVTACYDCHSNETRLAWYDKIAPASWWVTRHVEAGRRAMNFSEWQRRGAPLNDAIETVRNGSMPPGYYTWLGLHASARLSPAERQRLIRAFEVLRDRSPAG